MGSEEKKGAVVKSEPAKVPVRRRLGLYSDVNELQVAFEEAGRRANLLAPVTRIDFIPEGFSISLRKVKLDPSVDVRQKVDGRWKVTKRGGGDVYKSPENPDLLVPTKVGYRKLSDAAGISWIPERCRQMTDAINDPNYLVFSVDGMMVLFDGSVKRLGATAKMDLRDGSPRVKGWSQERKDRARTFILEMAESRAKNRAINDALSLKGGYTVEELGKEFVVPHLVLTGESSDPEITRVITFKMADRALGGAAALYPPADEVPALTPPPEREAERGAIPVESSEVPAGETEGTRGKVTTDEHGDVTDDGREPPDDQEETF